MLCDFNLPDFTHRAGFRLTNREVPDIALLYNVNRINSPCRIPVGAAYARKHAGIRVTQKHILRLIVSVRACLPIQLPNIIFGRNRTKNRLASDADPSEIVRACEIMSINYRRRIRGRYANIDTGNLH